MKSLIMVILACSLFGCATTETAQSIAAKSLLNSRQVVIGAAIATDALCKQKSLSVDNCMEAKKAYEQFQLCYGAASDSFLLYVLKGSGDYNSLAVKVLGCQKTFSGGVK